MIETELQKNSFCVFCEVIFENGLRFLCFKKVMLFACLKDKERERQRQNFHQPTGSFCKWPQWPVLGPEPGISS